jgi:hypothetical protein
MLQPAASVRSIRLSLFGVRMPVKNRWQKVPKEWYNNVVMEGLLWMFAMAGVITLAMRWLLLRGLSPMSRQAIRQLFVERLLATTADSCRLVHDDGQILTMQCGPSTCTIHFEALYRRCVEAPYRTMLFVRQAAQALQEALREADRLPGDWEGRVMPLLVTDELPVPPDLLLRPLTEALRVGYVVDEEEAFRWITRTDLQQGEIDEEQVHALALRNLERSCNGLVIETPPPQADGRDRLLRFRTQDGMDAARVLVPSFYRRFAPRFGDVDVVVAIPTRDTLIAIPATDQAQASFLQWRADTERRHSPHPLATQLLRVGEADITVWNPEEAEEMVEN